MFYWKYATQSLKRGGQRMVIALLCIAFGVMSLTAMQSVASTFKELVLVDPRLSIGGDASITRAEYTFLTPDDLAEIEASYQSGGIKQYSPLSYSYTQLMRVPGSARAYFINRVLGVDPTQYPLIGTLALQDGQTLEEALQNIGDTVITRDLADRLNLEVGDEVIIGGHNSSTPMTMIIRGIAQSTPDRHGQTVYFNLPTAQALWGRDDAITDVLVEWGDTSAQPQFEAAGWSMFTLAHQQETNERVVTIFSFMLNGAGIMGLLVGGIGVANTMQVLLAHRRKEIAVLKTMGYQPRDLVRLFGIETLLLGIIGSGIGAIVAIGVSRGLYGMMERTITMLFEWQPEPVALLSGLVIGILTTLLFGLYAIWQASTVPPAMLFRDLPPQRTWHSWLKIIGFYLFLAIPFSVITSLILGSVMQGIAILLLAFVGLITSSVLLGVTIWLTLRLLPAANRFRMAKSNIRRRWASTLFAVIALFLGVFALGFAVTVIDAARDQFSSRSLPRDSYNIAVFTEVADEAALQTYLWDGQVRYEADAASITDAQGNSVSFYSTNTLQGREQPWDVEITAGTWGADGVYVPQWRTDLAVGSELTVTLNDGTVHTLPVVGIYNPRTLDTLLISIPESLLLHRDLLNRLNPGKMRLMMAATLPVDRLIDESDRIGAAFPQAILVNSADLNETVTDGIRNLFMFAVALAGLALLAGVMLMANAVGLAIVDRQREIGVLKAVGYTRRDVLINVMIEYGLLGLIASVIGVIGVQVFIIILTLIEFNSDSLLVMSPAIALGVIIVGTLLTMGTAAAVAWQPTNIRPVTVLARE